MYAENGCWKSTLKHLHLLGVMNELSERFLNNQCFIVTAMDVVVFTEYCKETALFPVRAAKKLNSLKRAMFHARPSITPPFHSRSDSNRVWPQMQLAGGDPGLLSCKGSSSQKVWFAASWNSLSTKYVYINKTLWMTYVSWGGSQIEKQRSSVPGFQTLLNFLRGCR